MCQCYLRRPNHHNHFPSYLRIIVKHSLTLFIPNHSTLATNHERDREISLAKEDSMINMKHSKFTCACLWKALEISGEKGSINDRVLQEIPYTASQRHPTLRSRFLPKLCYIIFRIVITTQCARQSKNLGFENTGLFAGVWTAALPEDDLIVA